MRELGPARTKELVMTCDCFTSEDALRWGFINHRVPDAELLPSARAMAKKLLDKEPASLALTKSTCNALANQWSRPTSLTRTASTSCSRGCSPRSVSGNEQSKTDRRTILRGLPPG